MTTTTARSLYVESTHVCAAAMALIALMAAWQLGVFVVYVPGGTIPDTFASMDHPFHVARAEALRQSLLSGENLRWVGNHHGGYPAEYYPFGFAYAVVAVWALFVGAVPLPVVYKVVVFALFLAPGLVYWWMARHEGRPAVVALAAMAVHVAVAGGPWHGGSNELVMMGLSANVSSALLALVSLVALTAALGNGGRHTMAWAGLAAGAALWCNPRSAVALIACAVGASVSTILISPSRGVVGKTMLRVGVVSGLAALIAAPELASLVRFSDLYHFIRYDAYTSVLAYFDATRRAASLPALVFAAVGASSGLLALRSRPVTAATVVTLLVYVVMTLVLSFVERASNLIPQLETTRLMPFQRYLTIYLAATGLQAAAQWLLVRWPTAGVRAAQLHSAAIVSIVVASLIAVKYLPVPERSSAPQMSSLDTAVRAVLDRTPPDTAVLVVGSALSTHQQLWAPMVGDRPFFYDNWLWYWHTHHRGPYNSNQTSWYDQRRIADVFSPAYLSQHGIGAVVVTGDGPNTAASATNLSRLGAGTYSAYKVRQPTPIVTIGGRAADVTTIANHVITAESRGASGDMVVRRNWFPRWRATVNGRSMEIERTDEGYMRLSVPSGHVAVHISYVLDSVDWIARFAALIGFALIAYCARRTSCLRTTQVAMNSDPLRWTCFLPGVFTAIAAISPAFIGRGVNPLLLFFAIVWLMLGVAIARTLNKPASRRKP